MNREFVRSRNTADARQIYNHLILCDQSFVPPLSDRVDLLAYAEKLADQSVCYEAWSGADLIGLIAAYENGSNDVVFITNVSVLPDWQRVGVAAALMDDVLAHADSANISEIRLEVGIRNSRAETFYLKHGFEVMESSQHMNIMRLRVRRR
ncbi:MAG: GNAT family N-acetyltransferase [Gammaproteobacteria bacterium]|nr:GNAT family N-acetyltransferase [Gammaproteobacteria bacterium]MCP5135981.1 GNAT family N-acetyltransferase [Gammaproteobacteria bacterium]